MYRMIGSSQLNKIFSNLNNKEDPNYRDVLTEIQSTFPELSNQLQNDINSKSKFVGIRESTPFYNATLLHFAAKHGYLNVVSALLAHPEIEVNAQDKKITTPLHWAARKGHVDIVKALLAHPNIDVNAQDEHNRAPLMTPLHWAARKGHVDVVKALLAHPNIDVNAQDEDNITPLHYAAQKGYVDIVKALLAHPEIEVNAQDEHNRAPLFYAAGEGHVDIVKALLAHPNIDVNAQDEDEYNITPLYWAAGKGHVDIVKALLAHPNIDVNAQNENNMTPLHYAAITGHVDIVQALLARPEIEVNAQDEHNKAPLFYAVGEGHVDIVKALLAHPNIDVNAQGENNMTPLHYAVGKGDVDIVQALLAHPDIEVNVAAFNVTPLRFAIQSNHLEVSNLLIKNILFRNFNAEKSNFLNVNTALSNYWDQCKAETTQMSTYIIGNIRNRNISLNDFLTEKDDVKLVLYIGNKNIILKLQGLQSNSYKEFPIFADLLENRIQSRITEGERKRCLYDRVGKLEFKPLLTELVNIVNENLGNDHKSRLNLLLAFPSSRIEQPNVESTSPNNLHL